jgi:hypothetical protein
MHNSKGIKGDIRLDFDEANQLLIALRKADLEGSLAFKVVHRKVREIVDYHLYKAAKGEMKLANKYFCNKKMKNGVKRAEVGPWFPLPPVLVYDLRRHLAAGDIVRIANENNWNYKTVRHCLDLPSVTVTPRGVTKVRDAPLRYPLAVINQLLKAAENNRRPIKYQRRKKVRLRVYIEKNLKPFYHEFDIIETYIPGTPRQLAKAHKESVQAKYKAGLLRGEVPVQD